jgi:hypothetical protein
VRSPLADRVADGGRGLPCETGRENIEVSGSVWR